MLVFFQKFLQKNRKKIAWFSVLRIVSLSQILFWPFAFSKVINILAEEPGNWQKIIWWALLMITNELARNVISNYSIFELNKIRAKLKLSLAVFFTENTEIKQGVKTGEAVQAIRQASDSIDSLLSYYHDSLFRIPVNFILIPLIFLSQSPNYFFLIVGYVVLYFVIDYSLSKIQSKKMIKCFRAAEIFWGTTYRKVPDVWRKREDHQKFKQEIEDEGKTLYRKSISLGRTIYSRWCSVQGFSTLSRGLAVLFVLYKISKGVGHVGDLILVNSYFETTQGTLSVLTSGINQIAETKISLERLEQAVEIKE
jgi:ABC-type multidrug transport system fused ATPase/permease subunit